MIKLNNISIGYDSDLIQNFSSEIKSGQLIGLTGANGSGKSCLLATLAGRNPLLNGIITVEGKDLSALNSKVLSKRITYSSSRVSTYGNTSAFDIIAMGRIPHTGVFGKMSQTDYKEIDRAAELLKISHLLKKPFELLSDGEQQKTVIAKCLAQQTDIILLDEPMAFLDHPSRFDLFGLLKIVTRELGKLVLMSGHEPELLFQECDRTFLLEDKTLKEVHSGEEEFWKQFIQK